MAMTPKDWVPCMRCTRGSKGEKTCSAGWKARTLKLGCFMGSFLPGKGPLSEAEERRLDK